MATLVEKNQLIKEIKGIRRVVINTAHGGFGLSNEAVLRYFDLTGTPVWSEFDTTYPTLKMVTYWLVPPGPNRVAGDPGNWHNMSLAERQAHNATYSKQVFTPREIARDDPLLIKVVNELGDNANGAHAKLKVVEIPADVDWVIDEYDGAEWVAEKHRTWS